MRKSLAVVLLLLCCSQVGAKRVSRADFMVLCQDHSALAGEIMKGRQDGSPMADVMALAKGNRAAEQMVKVAYSGERLASDQARERAVADFENAVYAGCMNGAPRR